MQRILVVEDEPAIALGLKNDLTLEGYDVEVARDGEIGFERAAAGGFDLVVLDVMLPKKDGFEVCRELRRRKARVPIILLTARAGEAEKVLGLELGADDYVTKPFSPLELRARIKAVLRRGAPARSEVVRFGDVEVDLEACAVRRGGRPVELTPIEFKLLAALVRSHGRLLAREQLLDEVWGRGFAVTDRVIDNHMFNLRRKLEASPAEPRYLISVRGLGYRFADEERNQTNS